MATQSTHRYPTRYSQRQQNEQIQNTVAQTAETLHNTSLVIPHEEDEDGIELSEQQADVLSIVSEGRSVFITGPAGTGKTFLLRRAINVLKDLHGNDCVFITASTGIAASALSGTTLHSFAGIGCALEDVESLVSKLQKKRDPKLRWKIAKALVIDEINMIDGELFDKLNLIAKKMREPANREFGGLQLVVAGDFFQLAPVSAPNSNKFFAFQADCWDRCFDTQKELTDIFRQRDSDFTNMLNEIRRGVCSADSDRLLKTRQGLPNEEGVTHTKLYFLKVDAERENEHKLKELGKEIYTFQALDKDNGENSVSSQFETLLAVKKLSLCVDAQVMLIYNLDAKRGLVNGARGRVIGFQPTNESPDICPQGFWPIVQFEGVVRPETVTPCSWDAFDENGRVITGAKRIQIPLILAWALSVYKCQGMTLERVETDLARVYADSAYGMAYLVLSRLKMLEGLRLTGFNPSNVKAHPLVIRFYEELNNH